MSKYNSQKPLRMPPSEYGKWRHGEGANISTCHYCICEVCTGRRCRHKRKLTHCLRCVTDNDKMPVIVCDDFERKSFKRFRVVRRYKPYQQLLDILQSMDSRLKEIEKG